MKNCWCFWGQKCRIWQNWLRRAAYVNFVLCVEPCIVRQSYKSTAYDRIDPKELFHRLKKGVCKGNSLCIQDTWLVQPSSRLSNLKILPLGIWKRADLFYYQKFHNYYLTIKLGKLTTWDLSVTDVDLISQTRNPGWGCTKCYQKSAACPTPLGWSQLLWLSNLFCMTLFQTGVSLSCVFLCVCLEKALRLWFKLPLLLTSQTIWVIRTGSLCWSLCYLVYGFLIASRASSYNI